MANPQLTGSTSVKLTKMKLSYEEFIQKITKYISPDNFPYVVAVAGSSGSGKTFIAKEIAKQIPDSKFLSMDDYIIEEKIKSNENWDLPENWNIELLKKHLIKIHKNNVIEKPIYNFSSHQEEGKEKFAPSKVIIIEGIYAFYDSLSEFIDLKIFVDADEKIRLKRRIARDIKERGRIKEKVLQKWNATVEPTYLKFVKPQMSKADYIVINN